MSTPQGWAAGLYLGSVPWASLTRTLTSVTTTATALPATALANRKGMYLFNSGTANVYLGTSTVGTANDVILYPSQGIFLPVSDAVVIYGIVAAGSNNVVSWEYTAT